MMKHSDIVKKVSALKTDAEAEAAFEAILFHAGVVDMELLNMFCLFLLIKASEARRGQEVDAGLTKFLSRHPDNRAFISRYMMRSKPPSSALVHAIHHFHKQEFVDSLHLLATYKQKVTPDASLASCYALFLRDLAIIYQHWTWDKLQSRIQESAPAEDDFVAQVTDAFTAK
jgi:hypothetical protein